MAFAWGYLRVKEQRVWNGKMTLVCKCACCGAGFCLETLKEAQPIIESIRATVPDLKCGRIGGKAEEIARRIAAGYTGPLPEGLRHFAAENVRSELRNPTAGGLS